METTVLMCVKAVCKNREHHTKTSPRTISYISLSTSFWAFCFYFVCCFAAETMRVEMIAEVVGSDSAAQNHEILTWCQFYAAHHRSGSRKWRSLPVAKHGKQITRNQHKAHGHILLATLRSSAQGCRACAFIQQEMEYTFFWVGKGRIFFLMFLTASDPSRKSRLFELLHKACIFLPIGRSESPIILDTLSE